MPAAFNAGSASDAEIVLPHTWRPLGARIMGIVLGSLLLAMALFAWFAFPPEVRAQFSTFQKITMVVLTAGAYTLGYALLRSRVVAEDRRLVVVNGFRRREFDWAEVVAVHLPPGAPWATLDLSDGTTVSALAIQGSDGARARHAVRQLRALIS